MIQDNIKLAISNLSHRRLRSWLTMIGIFIGIAAVVSLIGLGEGLRDTISSQFGFLGTDTMSIQAAGLTNSGPPGTGAVTPLSDTLVDKVKKVNGVDTAYNENIRSATLTFNGNQRVGYIVSEPTGKDKAVFDTINNLKTIDGRLLQEQDRKGVMLGYRFTDSDFFGKVVKAGNTIAVNDFDLTVIGIVEKKGSFITDMSIYINQNTFEDIFGKTNSTDIIIVRVKDVKQISQVQSDIEKLLRKERDVKLGEEDFQVQTSQKALETLNSTLFAVQLFVYIIAGISLVVGGLGIMNTMYTAVLERTREIGIMKAIGARNSTVFTLFALESGFLGLVGGLIGIGLGVGLANGLSFIGRLVLGVGLLKASITANLIFGALIFSFGLGTIFGVLPAYQASRLQPVEALRK